MKTIRDFEQIGLFDYWESTLPSANFKRLKNSLFGLFRNIILETLPAEDVGKHFSEDEGRPTKELFSIIGLMILKEFKNWTTKEAVDAYLYDLRVHYALDTGTQVKLCERTLERYAKLIREEEGLASKIFDRVTETLIKEFDIEIDKQRLDSTHIYSDMATFTRTKLMAVAIRRFMVQLKRHEFDLYLKLPEDIRARYEKKEQAMFNDITKEQRPVIRQEVAEHMHLIIQTYAGVISIENMTTFKRMVTVFEQQCEVVDLKKVSEKDPADQSNIENSSEADSDKDSSVETVVEVRKKTGQNVMQNTSDPDATYDGHKGPGYQSQFAETTNKNNVDQLVTAVLPQTAAEYDGYAVEPVLKSLEALGILPEKLYADSAYGSDENVMDAAKKGVSIIAPVAGPEPKTPYANPTPKQLRLEKRREVQQTRAWKKEYNVRAQIEGTNSAIKRLTGLGKLRYRGKESVYMSIFLKLAGWNISRMAAACSKIGKKVKKATHCTTSRPINRIIRHYYPSHVSIPAYFTLLKIQMPHVRFSESY